MNDKWTNHECQTRTRMLRNQGFVIPLSFVIRFSSLFVLLNEFRELVEKVRGVMRTGCSLGMILHAEDRQFLVPHPLDCAVVQVDVCYFNVGRERLSIDDEAVVLCGDRHSSAAQIFYRLVGAAVAEFQFECRSAKGESENLM